MSHANTRIINNHATIVTVAVYAVQPTYDINCSQFMLYQGRDEHNLCLLYAGIQSIGCML